MYPLNSLNQSHTARRPFDDLDRALEIGGIQIRHLLLCDFTSTACCVIFPTLSFCGTPDPLMIPAAFFEQIGGRRRLHNKGERPVLIDRDDHRDDAVAFFLGFRVELLAKFHNVHAVLTQVKGRPGEPGSLFRPESAT